MPLEGWGDGQMQEVQAANTTEELTPPVVPQATPSKHLPRTVLERLADTFILAVSVRRWRSQEHRAYKFFEFSYTEEDSYRDMLRAAALTQTRALKHRYLRHALDEAYHAASFRTRAYAIIDSLQAQHIDTTPLKRRMESLRYGPIQLHESTHNNALFDPEKEAEFLAFVYLAERRGARQFSIYAQLLDDDIESQQMLRDILKDELFHASYPRVALDKMRKEGQEAVVNRLFLKRFLLRTWQAWLRFSRRFADVSNKILFGLIYLFIVIPTSWVQRRTLPSGNWQMPEQDDPNTLRHLSREY